MSADLIEEGLQILHQQNSMEGISRRGFKAKMVVETACILISMGDKRPNANRLCGACAAQQRILQERSTDPRALVIPIYGEARQNHDWHRTLRRLTLEQPFCRIVGLHLPNSKRVVAHHPASVLGYEDPRRSCGLGMSGVTMKPAI